MTEANLVRLADWDRDREVIRAIRETVFVIEQKVDPDLEWDGLDAASLHALAGLAGQPPVATGRLQDDGKIGRMAVLTEYRGRGLGKLILSHLIHAAREAGHASVYLHAQTHALPFYANAGFEAEGPEFDEAGIAHRIMRFQLDSENEMSSRELSNHQDYGDAVIDLLKLARREVDLFTPNLLSAVYDRPLLVEAVRDFVLQNKHARLRILLRSSDSVIHDGRRLLDLARRVDSKVTFRVMVGDREDRSDAFIVADARYYAVRREANTWHGVFEPNMPHRAKQFAQQFATMWEHAHDDPQLRELRI